MDLKEEKKETHILMVAFAALGHINPMLSLGKLLLSKGLHVTLATNNPARTFFPSPSTTTATGINLHFFSDGLSPDFDYASNIDLFMQTLAKFGPINLSTFIHHHAPKFSCIISNPFVPWVADVASDHGIPCSLLWIQPCTLYAVYYRFYNNLNEFPTLKNPHMSVDLPGLPLLHTQDLPSFVLPSNSFTSFPKVLAEVFGNMDKLKWVLGNSYYELEQVAIRSMDGIHPIIPVGPLVGQHISLDNNSLAIFKSDNSCIKWLNEQEPSSVIYISFGSIIEFSKTDIESISSGLKNSKHRFLWVVKGENMLPLGFLDETKEQGIIVKWCPQIEVLSHPSIGCFFSHCGWNSLLESITAGVPIIAYPQWTDQPTNAKLVTDVLRVGVRITRDEEGGLSSDEVAKCIEEVMNGPRSEGFKKNAAQLKSAAVEAVAEGGSSYRNIQMFVDDVVHCSCS
ncbi:hypothetical protein LguiA_027352 [Lonicera macranthoides]